MTLSPRTIRLDLKCGKGSISQGEKCSKGAATKANSKKKENAWVSKALMVGGAAATIGGIAYGVKKYKNAQAIAKAPSPNGKPSTPEQDISRVRGAFKEVKKISIGAQVAGAGLTLAGAGLYKYGMENKNGAASVAGAGLALVGANTFVGASTTMPKQFEETEQEFVGQAKEYKRQYYQAQEQAKKRQQQSGGYHSNSRTTPNKAVKDPFKDLGVSANASDAEIKSVWLKLLRENHPDLGGDPEKAKQINAAYQEILRRRGRKDSVWAEGFPINWDEIQP